MKRIFTLYLLIVATVGVAQESAVLRLKYEKGDTYLMKMNMNQNMGDGMMLMSMTMHMPIEIKSVNEDVFDTEVSFSKVVMNMEQGGMKMAYDSESKLEDMDEIAKQMHTKFGPMLEMVLGTKTNNLGEVLETKLIEGTGDVSQFAAQTQSVTYPKEKVTVGYSWSDKREENGMTLTYEYTVKSIDANNVILDLSGTITGAAEGTLSGNLSIDRTLGIPSESNITMDMDAAGQKIASTIELTMDKI